MSRIGTWLRRTVSASGSTPAKRVVVTGAAGYIGNALTDRLLEAGYAVTALDRLDFGDAAIRRHWSDPRFKLVEGDVRDVEAAARALKDAHALVHLAAVVGDPACAANEREAVETNRQATGMLAKLSRGLGVRRMILASTCSVYGSNPNVVDENSTLNPVSLYAETKIDAERLALAAGDDKFAVTALRIGTAFGWSRRPRFDLLVNLLTAKARAEGRAVIFNGERWRPFVHVNDIARGFHTVLAASPQIVAGQTFNLGSNQENHRLSSIADVLRELHPESTIDLEETEDRRDYRVDFSRIQSTLGFQAATTLAEGVSEIDEMLAAGLVEDYRQPQYHNVLAMAERTGEDAQEDRAAADLVRLGRALSESAGAAERATVSR